MSHEGDDYERQYMPGEGAILHRAKMRAPIWFFAVVALPIVIELITFAVLAATLPKFPLAAMLVPLLLAPVLLMVMLLFAVLRVTVSQHLVHVQYGLFGPNIPVSAIESAEVVSYDWKQYGGWGIRRGRDGSWAYNMMGDAGRAVKVVWQKDGKRVVHLLVSSDPEALAAAIRRARGGEERLRIGTTSEPVDEEPAAEAEQRQRR